MDKLDIRILRELAQEQLIFPTPPGPDLSQRAMAKRLGVSHKTVNDRLQKMRSSGFLMGSKVILHPGLLGLQMGTYGMEISPTFDKTEVIARLRLVEGMATVQNHHGNYIGLVFLYEDEGSLAKKLELIRRLGGASEGAFGRLPFPPCELNLKEVDWEIVLRLIDGSSATPVRMARELGVSLRTVRRRLSRMIEGRALFTQPNLDFGALPHAVPADAVVQYSSPKERQEAERQVLKLLDDHLFWAGVLEGAAVYSMILPNPFLATKLVEKVRKIQGVEAARIELVDEHIDQMEVFADYVSRHLMRTRGTGR